MTVGNPESYRDPGYVGRIKSLAGVLGREGAGLIVNQGSYAAGTSFGQILQNNPARKWAIIELDPDENEYGYIAFGDECSGTRLHLKAGGVLIINEELPWTGSVSVMAETATALFLFAEASVQE